MRIPRFATRRGRRGFALLAVFLTLLALLVLCTPFLLMAKNADQASGQAADSAEARLALDSAFRHARAKLGGTYPALGLDETPFWDSLDEVTVDNRFDPTFLDANDAHGSMWDLDVRDVAGLVDLDSASPLFIANLLDCSTHVSKAIDTKVKEIPVRSAGAFGDRGLFLIDGEFVHYKEKDGNSFKGLERGVGSEKDEDGKERNGGPRAPTAYEMGTSVVDQRAYALAVWRIATGELRGFDSADMVKEASKLCIEDGALTGADFAALEEYGSVFLDERGGRDWQHPVRLVTPILGDEGGVVQVDDPSYFNPGTTVLFQNSEVEELAVVTSTAGGSLRLDRILRNTFDPYETLVYAQVRRPVNVNTAPPEVLRALFKNLQLYASSSRIVTSEANALAALVVESRPFTGLEDFLRRVVLPASGLEELPEDADYVPEALVGGSTIIDVYDAYALYINGLNANDAELYYSTAPYSFVSRDLFDMDLRSTVNAPSGVQRTQKRREVVELAVPQQELLALWSSQEQFFDSVRINRAAPYWMSGPEPTSRYSSREPWASLPSAFWAHFGTWQGLPFAPGITGDPSQYASPDTGGMPVAQHVFEARDDNGFSQLWPIRWPENGQFQGRVEHFDHDTSNMEGRYLPQQVLSLATDNKMVQWSSQNELYARAIGLGLWIRPRTLGDAMIFDLGDNAIESDRITLGFESGDLVLRVLDGAGDHPATAFKERAEVRYSIAGNNSPGLLADAWHHISLDVRGNRPDQMCMLVNGLAHGVRTLGLTRLTSGVGMTSSTLPVESVEGFPDYGVARIGNELVEYRITGGALSVTRDTAGKFAGFGGRLSREEFDVQSGAPVALATLNGSHPVGTPVEVYGYSLPITSVLPPGKANLPSDLGMFRVARLVGVSGASGQGEPIQPTNAFNSFGLGMEGAGQSSVTGLVLAPADDLTGDVQQVMQAFSTTGGYAAIIQRDDWRGQGVTSAAGAPLGGIEIIRYSGWQNNVLQIAARGDQISLKQIQNASSNLDIGPTQRAFIAQWSPFVNVGGVSIAQSMYWAAYVFPISVPVPGASALTFIQPDINATSEFAQLTHVDSAELTEWIRYDELDEQGGHLVRCDPQTLKAVQVLLGSGGNIQFTDPNNPNGPPNGPGTPPNGPGNSGSGNPQGGQGMQGPIGPPSAPEPPQQGTGVLWDPFIGRTAAETYEQAYPFSRAFRQQLQFRGVMGTFPQKHTSGTLVLPVFHVQFSDANMGRPGRLDAAVVMGPGQFHPGWPVTVHRSFFPSLTYEQTHWNATTNAPEGLPPAVASGNKTYPPVTGVDLSTGYVALQDSIPEPMVPGNGGGQCANSIDTRCFTRLVKFPSGERPRKISKVVVGGAGRGQGTVPTAVLDEVVFSDTKFGNNTPGLQNSDTQGATMILSRAVSVGDSTIQVYPTTIRIPGRSLGSSKTFLSDLPQDAGLLRIGEEILAYEQLDVASGVITVAGGGSPGRGLLGTTPQPHELGDPVVFLEYHAMTVLSAQVQPFDATIRVKDLTGFPRQGTILVGTELMHYTRQRNGSLEMPRFSMTPGAHDEDGAGIFRGRFGTTPQAQVAGTPVIFFPARYWDRWAERADVPELSFFTIEMEQPAAFWRAFFWEADQQYAGGPRLGCLVRTDPSVPWDADPEENDGLSLHWQGTLEGEEPVPIGRQSDRIELRVFVKYPQGAFNLQTGAGHAWRQTPRLGKLGFFYIAPQITLASRER